MGNIDSSQTEISNSGSNLQSFNLPQYGGDVLVDKVNRLVFKNFIIPEHEQEDFENLIKSRSKLCHPRLAQLLQVQSEPASQGGFCSTPSKTYKFTYPLYVYSLQTQIQNCCKVRKPLPEREICRIFRQVVECIEYLTSEGTLHGDIKVNSIFMDRERGVKLLDSFFLKRAKTAYEVVLQDPRSMSLLAPEQLDLLKLKLFDSLKQQMQRQIFCIGMAMIEATTIQEGMRCYDLDQLRIRDEFFLYMMEHIQSCGYSYGLSNLIMNCVHRDPQRRPNFHQFLAIINQISR